MATAQYVNVEDLTRPELMARVLEGLYYEPTLGVPKQVLLPEDPADCDLYETWLSELRGSGVTVRVPSTHVDGKATRVTATRLPAIT